MEIKFKILSFVTLFLLISVTLVSSASAAYNGNLATLYAIQNANGAYTFSPNDCTSFASFTLRAGGWQDTGYPLYYSDDAWYFKSSSRPSYSNSWSVANSLNRFMSRHQERAIPLSTKAPYNKYKKGDIIQIDYKREGNGNIIQKGNNNYGQTDGIWDHSMVVVYISPDYSDMEIAQHGGSAPFLMFNDVKSKYPGSNFIGWSIR